MSAEVDAALAAMYEHRATPAPMPLLTADVHADLERRICACGYGFLTAEAHQRHVIEKMLLAARTIATLAAARSDGALSGTLPDAVRGKTPDEVQVGTFQFSRRGMPIDLEYATAIVAAQAYFEANPPAQTTTKEDHS